jgi:hypothetical protein
MSDIYLQITETPTVVTLSAPVISGALSSTVTVANVVTVALDSNSLSALENVTVTVGAAVTISNFPATQAVSLASVPTHGVTLASTTVTVSSMPAISGTVTAMAGSNFRTAIEEGILDYLTNDNFPVNIITPLPAGTNPIGSVTASISGTVPVSGTFWQATQPVSGTFFQATQPVSLTSTTVTVSSLPALVAGTANIGVVTIGNIRRGGDNALSQLSTEAGSNYLQTVVMPGTSQIGSVTASISNSVTIASFSTSVTARLINPAGTAVTYAEVGTAGNPSIDVLSVQGVTSGTPLNVYPMQGTTVSNTNFTSTTASTTLVSAVALRESLTVFNEGAGNLHISPGATCTTVAYQVRLSAGDYWECPQGQLSLLHTAVFATAGTARVCQVS